MDDLDIPILRRRPNRLVGPGSRLACGARFLKRVIDECVNIPISTGWHDGHTFHVALPARVART